MDYNRPRMFDWYELRTTDVDAATAFHAAVLGPDTLRDGLEITPLPERARAAGAPAHWLGHIAVPDLGDAVARMVAAGGEQRGPLRRDAHGVSAALRDPHGAAVGLRAGARRSTAVAWHELHVTDGAAALATYGAQVGWTAGDVIELGPPLGAYRIVLAGTPPRPAGAMLDSARQRHIHTHWMFYFAVPELAAALDRVRAGGGTVIGAPRAMPGGGMGAACEDPQGAAFALISGAA